MKYTTLKEHHLYSKTFQKGKRYSGKYASVFVLRDYAAHRLMLENPEKRYYNRFGLSVGKRVGGAVQRNRAKRVLTAAFMQCLPHISRNCDVVLVARHRILSQKSTQVYNALQNILLQNGIYE